MPPKKRNIIKIFLCLKMINVERKGQIKPILCEFTKKCSSSLLYHDNFVVVNITKMKYSKHGFVMAKIKSKVD